MTAEEFSAYYRDSLPNLPGVYRYYNEEDAILYIGKAKDLRKRVSSYFTKNDHSYRIEYMVRKIVRIEFTVVDTEQDAFLLENSLIKEHQPRYNVALKDDKTYPYIVIKREEFPRVFLTRRHIRDGSEYLGPYTSVHQVRIILNLLKSIFPLRTCTLQLSERNLQQNKFKVCLEYHLKNCLGPCQQLQSKEDYDESIRQIRNVLKSNFGSVMHYLRGKMNGYAEQLQFEKAEDFRQKIEMLTDYQSKSTIVNPKLNNIDVYGLSEAEGFVILNYLHISNGTITQTKSIEVKKVLDETPAEILSAAVTDLSLSRGETIDEILLPMPLDLPFVDIPITVPQIGDKKKLIDFAFKNASYVKMEKLKQAQTQEEKNPAFRIMKTLKEDLKLQDLPRHIECIDNSNIQGDSAVSSIVVFKDAKPSKKDYRFFNVATVVGANDFATMEEAVSRRYRRMIEEGQTLPNLIVIDGGKGQLSSAVKSLNALGIYGKVPIIGIAKKLEEIYFPEDTLPVYINKKSESLKLIQRIRDEAHRFGITAHRNKRSKSQTTTALTTIPGIGTVTMEKLITHFKSVKKLRETPAHEIAAIIGTARTQLLIDYFAQTTDTTI